MHFLSTWRQVFVTFRIARCTWAVLGLFGADSRLGPTCYGSAARRPAVSRAGASGPSGGGGGVAVPNPCRGGPQGKKQDAVAGRAELESRRCSPQAGAQPGTLSKDR